MKSKEDTGIDQAVHRVDTHGHGLSFFDHVRSVSQEARRLAGDLGLGYRAEFLGMLHDLGGGPDDGLVPGVCREGMKVVWGRYADALAAFAIEAVHRGIGPLDQSRLLALMAGRESVPATSAGDADGVSRLMAGLPPVASPPRCSLRGTMEELLDVRILASLVLEAEAQDVAALCWGAKTRLDGGSGRGHAAVQNPAGFSGLGRDWLARVRPPAQWAGLWNKVSKLDFHQAGLYWLRLGPDLDAGLTLFLAGLRHAIARKARRIVFVAPSAAAAASLQRHIDEASFHPDLQLTSLLDWGGRSGEEPGSDKMRLAMVLSSARWDVDVVFLDRQRFQSMLFSRHPQDFAPFHRLGRAVLVLWGDGFASHVTIPVLAALSGFVRRLMTSVLVGTYSHGNFDFLQEVLALWELEGWNAASASSSGHELWTAHGWRPRHLHLGNGGRPTGRDIPCHVRWPQSGQDLSDEDLLRKIEEPRQVLCRIGDSKRVQDLVRMLRSRGVGSLLSASFRHRLVDRVTALDRARRLVDLKAPCRLVVDDSVLGAAVSFPRVILEMSPLDVLLWGATCCGFGFHGAGGMEVLGRSNQQPEDALAVDVLLDLLSVGGWDGDALWDEELHREYYRRLYDAGALRHAPGPASVLADAIGRGDSKMIHSLGAGAGHIWMVVADDEADFEDLKQAAGEGVDRSWFDAHKNKAVQWVTPRDGSVMWTGLEPIAVRGIVPEEDPHCGQWYLLTRQDWYDPLVGFTPPED